MYNNVKFKHINYIMRINLRANDDEKKNRVFTILLCYNILYAFVYAVFFSFDNRV